MARIREFEGQSEEDAVDQACAALEIEADELDYTVLDEGSDGVLGLGKRPVRIRVRAPDDGEDEDEFIEDSDEADEVDGEEAEGDSDEDTEAEGGEVESTADDEVVGGMVGPAPEKAEAAKEVAEGLASRMGIDCRVSVRDEDKQIVVLIEEVDDASTDVAETLGKSRPPAIPSFQFLLNKIVNRFPDDRKHIVVEVPSVPRRERRSDEMARHRHGDGEDELDPTLVELARMLAERSMELKKVITVHPMAAGDRRAVHKTVMAIEGVQTVSEGEGLYRKMHIVPDSVREDGAKRKRRRRRRRRGPGDEGAAESGEDYGDGDGDEIEAGGE